MQDILKIVENQSDVDGVTITGGDPFLQKVELLYLVEGMKQIGIDDILIYTGFLYDELQKCEISQKILSKIAALVDGPYIDELNDNIGLRGSSNQKLYILNKKYDKRYSDFNIINRQIQNFVNNSGIISVGIPNRE